MAQRFIPFGNVLLVKPDEAPTQIGKVAIPQAAARQMAESQEWLQTGVVVAAGPGGEYVTPGGKMRRTMNASVGDRVVYHMAQVSPYKVDGQKYYIMQDDDLLGKLEGGLKLAGGGE